MRRRILMEKIKIPGTIFRDVAEIWSISFVWFDESGKQDSAMLQIDCL
jgi:hypothetical protein